jgi:hypothetical protein
MAGGPMRATRTAKMVALFVAVLGTLALASYLTTGIFWDGGFPSGEFRLNIQDANGRPVRGALLRVYHTDSRDLAYGYPLDNHVSGRDLVSDESGRITAIRKNSGLQFGGASWRLFWVILMGEKAPQYDCEISADNFASLKFPWHRLLSDRDDRTNAQCPEMTRGRWPGATRFLDFRTAASPHLWHEVSPENPLDVIGKGTALQIYEHAFTLVRR